MAGAPYVAVVGPSDPSDEAYAAAEAVGRELAQRGAVVVCGGRGGAMEAVCRGAASANGVTVGILPGEDRSEANQWVTIAVATGLGELRNGVVVRAADAVIALAGGHGTLSEIGFALRIGRPVIGLDTWDVEGVEVAGDPVDAVERALRSAG